MYKPTAKTVEALRQVFDQATVEHALAAKRPDLTNLLLRAAQLDQIAGKTLLAAVCRAACAKLGELHPGASIEVRVPPYAAVQVGFGSGPRHTRGTPPNVVEIAPETFIALISGRLEWADATVQASGVHAQDVAQAFPLI